MVNQKRYSEAKVLQAINFMIQECRRHRVGFDEFMTGFATAKDHSSKWRAAGEHLTNMFSLRELERALEAMLRGESEFGNNWQRITHCVMVAPDHFCFMSPIGGQP
jgi:hypothetical protein